MNNLNPWLLLAVAVMLIISTAIVVRSCNAKPVTDGEYRPIIEIVDTVRVHTVQEKTVYRDRIKAVIDTVYAEPEAYIARLDTLVTIPKGTVETKISFYHPQGLFDFWQNAKVQTDTVYVTKTKLIEYTHTKPNWWITAGGLVLGIGTGMILAH